ncbi:MAG: hypothetical protein JNL11_01340 [Bdellovibrionaceae bacterium]|nr:hypothetical protein [Pseudobdellovibrionaceae bacterium]
MNRWVLVLLSVAASSMVYQFLVITALTYILGDGLVLFCVFTGVFMSAMGLGAYLAGECRKTHEFFVRSQLVLAVSGFAILPVIFSLYSVIMARHFQSGGESAWLMSVVMWPIGLAAEILFGTLLGMQLPLLQQITKDGVRKDMTLSKFLALDYVGSFLGAAAFPLILFPMLGMFRTAFAAALLNTIMAGVSVFGNERGKVKYFVFLAALSAGIVFSFFHSSELETFFDAIVYG